jgi:hypothetical protein
MLNITAACDKVYHYQLLAHGRWFSPASCTTKTGRHDIAEILLKVALKDQKSNQFIIFNCLIIYLEFHTFVQTQCSHHLGVLGLLISVHVDIFKSITIICAVETCYFQCSQVFTPPPSKVQHDVTENSTGGIWDFVDQTFGTFYSGLTRL